MAEKIRKSFVPITHKNYENALRNLLTKEYQFLGGPKILDHIVMSIKGVTDEYYVPKECVSSGEMLWTAVTTKMSNVSKKMVDTEKKIVKLPLVDKDKIHDLISKEPMREIKKMLVGKLAKRAYEQDATLSCADIAAIMTCSPATISKYSREIADEQGEPLPLRGFVHDIGPSISHKIPIIKEYLRGNLGKKVAESTRHSQKATDRYIQSFEKVKLAKKYTSDIQELAYMTGQSRRLVKEYLFLLEQFEKEVEKHKNEQV